MWPFTRRPRPPIRRLCLETWRPGDVAECVNDSWLGGPPHRPRFGARSIVLRVHAFGPAIAIELAGHPDRWDATAFRKVVVTPIAEVAQQDEAADA